MRSLFIWMLALLSYSASAQWGTGYYSGTSCNEPFKPAPQAHSGSDELANVRGQVERDNRLLQDRQREVQRLDDRVSAARNKMTAVISTQGMTAIEEHYTHRRERNAYQQRLDKDKQCGLGVPAEANLIPVPEGFCYETEPGKTQDLWERVAHIDQAGRVNEDICRYHFPPQADQVAPTESKQNRCREGLAEYYAAMEERARLNQELQDLRSRVAGSESRIGRVRSEVAEGSYCATCASERRGYSSNSTGDQMTNMVMPLMVMGAALLSRSQQQQRRPPAFRAFPARPYAAPTPGYYGTTNGTYGALPGSIGRGAFACNGTSPSAFDDPMFANNMPSIFGGTNPFNSPYADAFMDPSAQNRLFNPGYGPSFAPRLAGNAPGILPVGNRIQGPGRLPWQNRAPMTQMPNRFGRGPAPALLGYSRPGVLNNQFGQYQQTPLYTAAPALTSYYSGGNSGGATVSNGVLGNYTYQMNQISNNIQLLGSGGYYGGGAPIAPPAGPGIVPPKKK